MKVSIGSHWEDYVDEMVRVGRYGSANEVILEGLRLVEEQENKLQALRDTLNASIERGGSFTSEEVMAHVEASLDDWERARQAH